MSVPITVPSGPHTRLHVPYVDTRADQLRYSLSAPPAQALAQRDHEANGLQLSLRLLGASHQVLVDVDDAAGGVPRHLRETVACLPELDGPLPPAHSGRDYRFTSVVRNHPHDRLAEIVDQILTGTESHSAAGHPAVAGCFPGDPLAVTAILADVTDTAVSWQTWHTYPQAGDVVLTRSEFLYRTPRTTEVTTR